MKNVFSENMKMADLVCHNSKLLSVLSRFEINLGFGDRSVGEVCNMYNVDKQFFLLICNVYCDEDFTPHYEDLKCVNIDSMIKYLHISHNYYLHERLPHIEEHFNRIIEACPSKYAIPLKRFSMSIKMKSPHISSMKRLLFSLILKHWKTRLPAFWVII